MDARQTSRVATVLGRLLKALLRSSLTGALLMMKFSHIVGAPIPKPSGYDVSAWTERHSLVLDRRQGWFAVAFVLGVAVFPAILGYGVTTSPPSLIAGAVVAGLGAAYWLGWGGRLTIDPIRQQLAWKRPFGLGSSRVWSYDAVRMATVLRDGTLSHRVRIDFVDHHLTVRLPPGAAEWRFAESLADVAQAGR